MVYVKALAESEVPNWNSSASDVYLGEGSDLNPRQDTDYLIDVSNGFAQSFHFSVVIVP